MNRKFFFVTGVVTVLAAGVGQFCQPCSEALIAFVEEELRSLLVTSRNIEKPKLQPSGGFVPSDPCDPYSGAPELIECRLQHTYKSEELL